MTNYYPVHLLLVSAQPTPNLTPALDPAIKPHRVILLVSPDMRERAEWLEQIYRPRGIQVSQWAVENAWDIAHIQDRILELFVQEDIQESSPGIALNATGGTKPMSIAAFNVFRELCQPAYYVHPESDQLIWLYPDKLPPHQLADRIKIPDFVRAHGASALSKNQEQVSPVYRKFSQQLIDQVDHFSGALGTLNWYAHTAADTLNSVPMEEESKGYGPFPELLDRLQAIGILQIRGNQLRFADEAARFYANGGWLEQHVFAMLNGLKKEMQTIQDTAQGLTIQRGENGSRNELDVVALANNRLHLIECKAKNFRRGEAHSGADTLYKLDSLVDTVGGLQARAMLVSYRKLVPADAQRARDLRIKVLQGRQLQQLDSHLKAWLS